MGKTDRNSKNDKLWFNIISFLFYDMAYFIIYNITYKLTDFPNVQIQRNKNYPKQLGFSFVIFFINVESAFGKLNFHKINVIYY